MKVSKRRQLIDEIEARYRGTRVVVRPSHDPENPGRRWFLWVLDVPEPLLGEVSRFAIGRAHELYGDNPLPFYVSSVDPETTAKHFPQEPKPARTRASAHGAD